MLAALVGLALVPVPYFPFVDAIVHGRNDFAMLYAGSRLVATPYLYDAAAGLRLRGEVAHERSPSRQYTRLPFLAALLWPLGKLNFLTAYWTFQALSVLALILAILLWPGKRAWFALACCWSVPVFLALAQGQDVLFLLLWISLALRWADRRPFAAGLVLALCATKFHLFLPLPVLLIARREGRIAAGLATGGGILAAISFAVAGLDWPARFLNTISSPVVNPGVENMPNLHNLLAELPGRTMLELVLAIVCLAIVWMVGRRSDRRIGLATALIAGILTSVHAYPQDCVLLIPAMLLLAPSDLGSLRYAAIALLLPIWYLLPNIGGGRLLPLLLLCLLAGLAWRTTRRVEYEDAVSV